MHEVGIQHRPDLDLDVAPHLTRGGKIEMDLREPRRGLLSVADERHAIPVIDLLHRRGDGHAGSVQADERPPFVSDPAVRERLLAESRPLAAGAALPPAAPPPYAGRESAVAERAPPPPP